MYFLHHFRLRATWWTCICNTVHINFQGKVMKAPLLDILTRIRRKTSELGAIFLL